MHNNGLVLHAGVWYLDVRKNGARIRRSLRTADATHARQRRDAFLRSIATIEPPAGYEPAARPALLAYLRKCRGAAITRDRRRRREPDLSHEAIVALLDRSARRCEVTGIPFSLAKAPGTSRRPFAPSIDRRDNGLPYSLANCRLACVAANVAINVWGEQVFGRLAMAFLAPELPPVDTVLDTPHQEKAFSPNGFT